jgi:hypothetical protein
VTPVDEDAMLIDRSSALERGSDGGDLLCDGSDCKLFSVDGIARAMSMGWCDGDALSYCDADALMAMN